MDASSMMEGQASVFSAAMYLN